MPDAWCQCQGEGVETFLGQSTQTRHMFAFFGHVCVFFFIFGLSFRSVRRVSFTVFTLDARVLVYIYVTHKLFETIIKFMKWNNKKKKKFLSRLWIAILHSVHRRWTFM